MANEKPHDPQHPAQPNHPQPVPQTPVPVPTVPGTPPVEQPAPIKSAPRRYTVVHGSLGLDPATMKYSHTKGDTILLAPEDAAAHLANGLIAEV